MKKLIVLYVFLFTTFTVFSQSIEIATKMAGTLYWPTKISYGVPEWEVKAILWDNDNYSIPIDKPGTYMIGFQFVNGQGIITREITITSRDALQQRFGETPVNVRVVNDNSNKPTLYWNTINIVNTTIVVNRERLTASETGPFYKVYFGTSPNVSDSKLLGITDKTNFQLLRLKGNTNYYFWVSSCSNQRGTNEGPKSQPTNSRIEYYVGGQGPAGGRIFYDKGSNSDGWRYLEAAPYETVIYAPWGARTRFVQTNNEIGWGRINTQNIINTLNILGEQGKAAQICVGLIYNGFNDWFLPSYNEITTLTTSGEYWSSNEAYVRDIDANTRAQARVSRSNDTSRNKDSNYPVLAIRSF